MSRASRSADHNRSATIPKPSGLSLFRPPPRSTAIGGNTSVTVTALLTQPTATRRRPVSATSTPVGSLGSRTARCCTCRGPASEAAPEVWPGSQRAGLLAGALRPLRYQLGSSFSPLHQSAQPAIPLRSRVSTTARIGSVTRGASDQPRERPVRVSELGPRTSAQRASVPDSRQSTPAPGPRVPSLDRREPRSARRAAGRRYVARVPAASCHDRRQA